MRAFIACVLTCSGLTFVAAPTQAQPRVFYNSGRGPVMATPGGGMGGSYFYGSGFYGSGFYGSGYGRMNRDYPWADSYRYDYPPSYFDRGYAPYAPGYRYGYAWQDREDNYEQDRQPQSQQRADDPQAPVSQQVAAQQVQPKEPPQEDAVETTEPPRNYREYRENRRAAQQEQLKRFRERVQGR